MDSKGSHHYNHYNQTIQSQTKEKSLESIKREATCHIQGVFNQIISRFHIRNFGNQKAVGIIYSSAKSKKRKKLSTKNSIYDKTALQK
jgi:hypothetical protein